MTTAAGDLTIRFGMLPAVATASLVTDPIIHEYTLDCSPRHAFDTYVQRIGEWWHSAYTADAATFQTVTIAPGLGGAVTERHRDGREIVWGHVTAWEPGRRLAYTSTLAQPPDHPSEITVQFLSPPATPSDPSSSSGAPGVGCTMRFEHGGWHAQNAARRSTFREWPIILARYVALADGQPLP